MSHCCSRCYSVRNSSWPSAIFLPISTYGQPKIYSGWPNLIYIFNGRAINNLQEVLSSKRANQFLILISTTAAICCYNHVYMLCMCLLLYTMLLLVNVTLLWCRYCNAAATISVVVIMCKCGTYMSVIVCDVVASKCHQKNVAAIGYKCCCYMPPGTACIFSYVV